MAGFASNKTSLALSLITSGLNALGSIVSMVTVDRYGRRRLMILSMIGIIVCLVVLSIVFFEASAHSPYVSRFESTHFGGNSTCPKYLTAPDASSWSCTKCLQASKNYRFCANAPNKVSFIHCSFLFNESTYFNLYVLSSILTIDFTDDRLSKLIAPLLTNRINFVCSGTFPNLFIFLISIIQEHV